MWIGFVSLVWLFLAVSSLLFKVGAFALVRKELQKGSLMTLDNARGHLKAHKAGCLWAPVVGIVGIAFVMLLVHIGWVWSWLVWNEVAVVVIGLIMNEFQGKWLRLFIQWQTVRESL